ncbi:restriction endonuclease subunit S [Burkholderia sp. LMU1-1-1.1]|uniref:restriction endonuclease subunit S n=1 Tax=Burkholderia sp. LMU1-1-1.1 TaxID=3135266 RepID=UPI00344775C7
MSSEWIRTTIGSQSTLQRGFDITKAAQREGPIPVISSAGISSRHDTAMVKGPGVVLGRKGVVGSVHFVEGDYWPHDTTLWVKDFHGNNELFTYYFFRAHASILSSLDVGSANPTLNRNHVHPIEVSWPGIQEQEQIASFLGVLDDRISLLRETNATLEGIAQALFKSWFVDFDPVRAKTHGRIPEGMDEAMASLFPDGFEESELGLVPRGWSLVPLYDLATYINGAAYKAFSPNLERRGLPIIKIAELKAGVSSQTAYSDVVMPEKYRINTGDILFSWSGNPDTSINTFVWIHGQAWLNQHIFRVLPREEHERSFLLRALKHLRPVFAELARNKQTTGLGHVTVADLKRLRVPKPDNVLLSHFDSVVSAIHDMMFNNDRTVQSLVTIRDTLLPRLIFGQLRLSDVEPPIEAIAA